MQTLTITLAAALTLAGGILLSGCQSSRAARTYSRQQAQQVQEVSWGTVRQAEPVRIEGTKTPIGVVGGAAAGGAIGHTIGGGSGKVVATVLGAIVGGIAGAFVEEKATSRDAVEVTVELETGKTIVLVQEADESFVAGDRVRLIKAPDGTTRVRH